MGATLTPEEAEAIAREHDAQMKPRAPSVRSLRRAIAGKSAQLFVRARHAWNGGHHVTSDGTSAEIVTELTRAALTRVLENRSCALVVRGFGSRETCDLLADWMLEKCHFEKWEQSSRGVDDLSDMFYGVGIPVTAVTESRERCVAYFDDALPTMRRLRAAAGGRLTPVDQLRLELDEVWPHGANVRVDPVYRRKMLAGLGRLMRPDGMVGDETSRTRGIIHTDASPFIDGDAGLFTANVYLRTPSGGGELDVWPVAPARLDSMVLGEHLQHSFEPKHRERTQRALRSALPEPCTVAVAPGDLVIFNSGRPHAVRGFTEGRRVTVQSFIDYSRAQPLTLYS